MSQFNLIFSHLKAEAKRPLIASAVRAEKLMIDGKPFDVRKGELFVVLETGSQWKVKPMERRSNDIVVPSDLLIASPLPFFCPCFLTTSAHRVFPACS